MDSGDLVFFAAVAKFGSISKAASLLDTVQSNVTQRIRRLENELGVPLFYRNGRGVTLTPAGVQLLPYASQIDQMMDEARRVVANEASPVGQLRIGSMETTAAIRMPEVLVNYAAEYPNVDVTFQTGTTQGLIDEVKERRLEAALVAGPVDDIDLVSEAVLTEELVVVTAPWFVRPIDDRPAWVTSPKEVKIVVFRNGCSYRERLESLLIRQGVRGIKRMEIGTLDGLLGCVRAGIAISLLPRVVVEPWAHADKIAIHPLPKGQGLVDTVLIRRRDGFVSTALNCFIEKLQNQSNPSDEDVAVSVNIH
ncbi:DNA-binding transcriptional LysR family regulator [Pseudomonas sp. JUb42]|jgi:DNA-binding transcriptional LysR family regulator|uniref:LysR family transcriptional regulator n=1 Tax=Pseudomonas sp. JUb42 TaxID=2940611 RepID=UPI0021689731|nr:LysR family transcriptional regulator [Pseudomonas sp. JUb42]MCS3468758.1 DNA-binding transcriptional LysR family regulator [Pseudomonas sp. JUb42]